MRPPLRIVMPGPAHVAAHPDAPWTLFFPTDPAVVDAAIATGLDPEVDEWLVTLTVRRAMLPALADALVRRGGESGKQLRRAMRPVLSWQLRTRDLPLHLPHIMGIVNLTEDSFSGDGVGRDVTAALRQADALRRAGAAIIDVGGETARADRPVMEAATEARFVAPVVEALTREGHIVSIDTYKPIVARAALDSGAECVNDISGLTIGTGAAEEAARAGAGYVLNYSYSAPKRRPDAPPLYRDVVEETVAWMFERVAALHDIGLVDPQIAIDPGIAFGKSHDEDMQVLRRLGELRTLGLAILLAHSRKNFIGSVGGRVPAERDLETHVTSALAYGQGARIFRVHDAEGARRALEMAAALTTEEPGGFGPDGESWPWRAGASAAHMTRSEPDKDAPKGQRW